MTSHKNYSNDSSSNLNILGKVDGDDEQIPSSVDINMCLTYHQSNKQDNDNKKMSSFKSISIGNKDHYDDDDDKSEDLLHEDEQQYEKNISISAPTENENQSTGLVLRHSHDRDGSHLPNTTILISNGKRNTDISFKGHDDNDDVANHETKNRNGTCTAVDDDDDAPQLQTHSNINTTSTGVINNINYVQHSKKTKMHHRPTQKQHGNNHLVNLLSHNNKYKTTSTNDILHDPILDNAVAISKELEKCLSDMNMIQVQNAILMDSLTMLGGVDF